MCRFTSNHAHPPKFLSLPPAALPFFFFFFSRRGVYLGKREGLGWDWEEWRNIVKKTLWFRRKQCHANAIIISILAEYKLFRSQDREENSCAWCYIWLRQEDYEV